MKETTIESRKNKVITTNPYAEEARSLWGKQYEESVHNLAGLSPAAQKQLFKAGEENTEKLLALYKSKANVTDPYVQDCIKYHYSWISKFWTPNYASFMGLASSYVNDERFAAYYNAFAPGFANFLSEAMCVWTDRNLPERQPLGY